MLHLSEKATPEDDLYYLRTPIKDKALEIAKRLKLAVKNYRKIWKDHEAYYENLCRLAQAHLTDFFKVSPMKSNSYTSLNKFAEVSFARCFRNY